MDLHMCALQARLGLLANALAGGVFGLGDRVACSRKGGMPPLGVRGTIVGVHDDACEVLFDAEFNGGSDLYGRLACPPHGGKQCVL